uniref:Uncharacterized protein n=1 Tax=Ditylenchus dipsaci TaxID=166011 RepID=A0A915DG60_9BILA
MTAYGKRPSAFFVILIWAAYLCSAQGQNFETGDNATVVGCSSHCSYRDDTLECWNKTLHFFEHLLLGQMRHYVAVQMNIDQWRRRHIHPYTPEFELSKQMSITSMKSHLQPEDIVNSTTVELVVGALVDLAAMQSTGNITWMPHYSCPIPCEYRFFVWRNLFIASSILNVLLLIAILPFVKRMTRSDASEALIGGLNRPKILNFYHFRKTRLYLFIPSAFLLVKIAVVAYINMEFKQLCPLRATSPCHDRKTVDWIHQQNPEAAQTANMHILKWLSDFCKDDGILLAKLANGLSPGSIECIYTKKVNEKQVYKDANIEGFIDFAKNVAKLADGCVFLAEDLQNKYSDSYKAVFYTLYKLGIQAPQKFGKPGLNLELIAKDASTAFQKSLEEAMKEKANQCEPVNTHSKKRGTFRIFVITTTGSRMLLTVHPNDSVESLKAAVQDKEVFR